MDINGSSYTCGMITKQHGTAVVLPSFVPPRGKMGKKSNDRRSARATEDIVMHNLDSSGGGEKKTRNQLRFERATKDAVQAISRRNLAAQDLAATIRQRLNNLHGSEWHCFVGKVKAFNVHVRYWRGKSFLFDDSDVKMLVFQSAPPAPDQAATCQERVEPGEGGAGDNRTGRVSTTVLRSEMDPAHQKRVLGIASSVAGQSFGKNGRDLDGIVLAIKASLTELNGPVWHVVASRGSGEWGFSVSFEAGQLLDFKLNGDRIVVWKHAQAPPGLAELFTVKRTAWVLFGVTVLLLVLYIRTQASCNVCCSSSPERRAKARCAENGASAADAVDEEAEAAGGVPFECVEGSEVEADGCLQNATVIFYIACATLAVATALRWNDRRSKRSDPLPRLR